MNVIEINVVDGLMDSVNTDKTPLKNKRKCINDDYTPRSRHVDKKQTPEEKAELQKLSDFQALSIANQTAPADIVPDVTSKTEFEPESGPEPDAVNARPISQPSDESQMNSITSPEFRLEGTLSIGSFMSHADSVNDPVEDDGDDVLTTKTENDGDGEDNDAPSMSEGMKTPRNAKTDDATFDTEEFTRTSTKTPISRRTPRPQHREVDLLSFQTPVCYPRHHGTPELRRFVDTKGEELLLDVTPRVYSPQSIPIYTLRDLEKIKADFDDARRDLEQKVLALREELAQSVSNSVHHKALAAQGESLHVEYSKKHVRKVTALKAEWERKHIDRTAQKDRTIADLEERVARLNESLEQERLEKKEVIEMAEAVLKMASPAVMDESSTT